MTSANEASQPTEPGSISVGVKTIERVADPVVGAVLVARGLKRRSVRGAAMAVAGGGLLYRGIAVNASIVRTNGEREAGAPAQAPELQRTITIGKSPAELYQRWRAPTTLPQLMAGIAEVEMIDNDRARWTVNAPLGKTISWETRIIEDRPGELIRWESMEGSPFPNEGSVEFRSGSSEWGAEMTLRFRFAPPGGRIGDAVMKVADAMPKSFFVPNLMAGKVLRRFKSLVETGEIPTTKGQPAGRDDDK